MHYPPSPRLVDLALILRLRLFGLFGLLGLQAWMGARAFVRSDCLARNVIWYPLSVLPAWHCAAVSLVDRRSIAPKIALLFCALLGLLGAICYHLSSPPGCCWRPITAHHNQWRCIIPIWNDKSSTDQLIRHSIIGSERAGRPYQTASHWSVCADRSSLLPARLAACCCCISTPLLTNESTIDERFQCVLLVIPLGAYATQ